MKLKEVLKKKQQSDRYEIKLTINFSKLNEKNSKMIKNDILLISTEPNIMNQIEKIH